MENKQEESRIEILKQKNLKQIKKMHDTRMNKIMNKYKNTEKTVEGKQSTDEYMRVSLIEAEKMWYYLQTLLEKNAAAYARYSDTEKIKIFKNDFDDFFKEFPVVSRYMICIGQYNQQAFEKYLRKCKSTVPDNTKRTEDNKYIRNMWIERQADYVRFLWESQQKNKINKKESNNIWKTAYESLTKEFADFENKYDEYGEKIKKDDIKYKQELLTEYVNDTIKNKNISGQDAMNLLKFLKEKKIKQNFRKVCQQVCDTIDIVPAKLSGMGTNQKLQYNYDQELKMKKILDKNSLK